MTDHDVAATVLTVASNDPDLTDAAKLLIMAALESQQMLDEALQGDLTSSAVVPVDVMVKPEPVGAFLRSIRVQGFRGVGPQVTLTFQDGPGLTVIAGRNGSGKSTIAEALELALTGDTYRWARRSSVWKDSWRNMHQGIPCSIGVDIAVEGVGLTTIGVDWANGAEFDERTVWWQRKGEKRNLGLQDLGWDEPMRLFRPLLSYEELGGRLEAGPSELHDALEKILGLGAITDAQHRLADAAKSLAIPVADARTRLAELKGALAASTDGRAAEVTELLRKRWTDLDAVERVATGTSHVSGGSLDLLRSLTSLSVPDRQQVEQAAGSLRRCVSAVVNAGDTASTAASDRMELLQRALQYRAVHGDGQCPVCETGVIDEAWALSVTSLLESEHEQLASLRAAQQELNLARQAARTLLDRVRPIADIGDDALTALPAAVSARAAWAASPNDDTELADHLIGAFPELERAVTALRDQATSILLAREDRWAPLATLTSQWVAAERAARDVAESVKAAKAAQTWLKARAVELRNQRLEPLADKARAIWAGLRQESNVELGAIRLAGSATRRHVDLRAEVDGKESGALSVMSQGELHALALALFLPRATVPESPFRFIVLDDPIQAMDPSKVEGFVQVLAELAEERQVIVLSHDDRLPDALRRGDIRARILEVVRMPGSRVQISNSVDPAARYLSDARAVAKDPGVPDVIKRQLIPGMCRMALESVAFDVYAGKQYAMGVARTHVEDSWEDATKVRQRVALALHGDRVASIDSWVSAGPRRAAALAVCNSAVHQGSRGDFDDDVRVVSTAVDDLRGLR